MFRVHYQGPEGRLSFRLTLYLLKPEAFRLEASDGIGRRVFSLDYSAAGTVAIDHRNREFCRLVEPDAVVRLPLAVFSPRVLARLLLGAIPADPATELARSSDAISFKDRNGQAWSGGTTDGRLIWWSMSVAGEAVAWWQSPNRESIFSDRRGQQQVRWTQLVAESLRQDLPALQIPADYQPSCESIR